MTEYDVLCLVFKCYLTQSYQSHGNVAEQSFLDNNHASFVFANHRHKNQNMETERDTEEDDGGWTKVMKAFFCNYCLFEL